jgi:hypothetical protein
MSIFPGTRKAIPTKHLNTRLRIAQEEEDEEAFNKISAIIQQEQQRNFGDT